MGWKIHLIMASFLPRGSVEAVKAKALPLTQPYYPGSDRSTVPGCHVHDMHPHRPWRQGGLGVSGHLLGCSSRWSPENSTRHLLRQHPAPQWTARNNGWWLLLQSYYRLRKLQNTENWLAVGEVTGERVVHCVFIHGVLHVGVLLQCIVLFLGKWIDYKKYLFTCLIIYYLETAKYQKNVTLNPIWLGTKVCCTFLWMKINLPCGWR